MRRKREEMTGNYRNKGNGKKEMTHNELIARSWGDYMTPTLIGTCRWM